MRSLPRPALVHCQWGNHEVGTLQPVNEVVALGFAVAEFFRTFTSIVRDRPILAHFHEWMGGIAVPRIAHMRLPLRAISSLRSDTIPVPIIHG